MYLTNWWLQKSFTLPTWKSVQIHIESVCEFIFHILQNKANVFNLFPIPANLTNLSMKKYISFIVKNEFWNWHTVRHCEKIVDSGEALTIFCLTCISSNQGRCWKWKLSNFFHDTSQNFFCAYFYTVF